MEKRHHSFRAAAVALLFVLSGCATVDGALQKGDAAAAAGLAEKQKSPDREASLAKVADAYYEKKEFLRAGELYEKAGPQGKAGLKNTGLQLAQREDLQNAERFLLASGMPSNEAWSAIGSHFFGIGKIDIAYDCFAKAQDVVYLKKVADEYRYRGNYAKAEAALKKAGVPEKDIFVGFGRSAMPAKPGLAAEFYEKAGNAEELAKAAAQLSTVVAKKRTERLYSADKDQDLAAYAECVNRLDRLGALEKAAPIIADLIDWDQAKRVDALFPVPRERSALVSLAARTALGKGRIRYAFTLAEKAGGREEFLPLLEKAEKDQWTLFAGEKDREPAASRLAEIGKIYAETGKPDKARATAAAFARAGRYSDALTVYRAAKGDEKEYGTYLFEQAAAKKDKYYVDAFARMSGVKKNLVAAADILMEKERYLAALELYEEAGVQAGAAKAFSVISAAVGKSYDDPAYEPLMSGFSPAEKRSVTILLYFTSGGAEIGPELDAQLAAQRWIGKDGVAAVKKIEARYAEFCRYYGNAALGLPPKTEDRDAIAQAIIEKSKQDSGALMQMNWVQRNHARVSDGLAKATAKAK